MLGRRPVIAAPLEGKVSCVSRWPSQALTVFVTRLGRFHFADPQGVFSFPTQKNKFCKFQRLHLDAQILGHFWKKFMMLES